MTNDAHADWCGEIPWQRQRTFEVMAKAVYDIVAGQERIFCCRECVVKAAEKAKP